MSSLVPLFSYDPEFSQKDPKSKTMVHLIDRESSNGIACGAKGHRKDRTPVNLPLERLTCTNCRRHTIKLHKQMDDVLEVHGFDAIGHRKGDDLTTDGLLILTDWLAELGLVGEVELVRRVLAISAFDKTADRWDKEFEKVKRAREKEREDRRLRREAEWNARRRRSQELRLSRRPSPTTDAIGFWEVVLAIVVFLLFLFWIMSEVIR